jgi:transcriptional regulator GlxA family with amidase domain
VSVSLASQGSEMTSIRESQIWIAEHLKTRLSVEGLADHMSMSVRNFERVFTRELARRRPSMSFRCAWRQRAGSSNARIQA